MIVLMTALLVQCYGQVASHENDEVSESSYDHCYYKNPLGQCFKKMVVPDIDESLNELDQEDPKLIDVIRQRYLIPPPTDRPLTLPITGDKLKLGGQFGQVEEVDKNYFPV